MLDIKCNINEHIIYKEKEKLEQGFTGGEMIFLLTLILKTRIFIFWTLIAF